mgnify:CR=1 FL=1
MADHPMQRETTRKKELEKLEKQQDKNLEDKINNKLSDKNFLPWLVEVVKQTNNVVGEDYTIEALIVIFASIKVKNKETISSNICLDAISGAGKDFMLKSVLETLYPSYFIKYSDPSPTNILHDQDKYLIEEADESGQKKKVWKTCGKPIKKDTILYIKDASQDWFDNNVNKLLLEDDPVKNDRYNPKQGRSGNAEFPKPTIAISTTETDLPYQLLRRLPTLHLDESKEQSEKVIQQKIEQGSVSFKKQKSFDDAEIAARSIESLDMIKVGFSKEITDYIKSKSLLTVNEKTTKEMANLMKSLSSRMMDYIRFYAALYQKQREMMDNGVIRGSRDDVDRGMKLFKYIYGVSLDGELRISNLNQRQKTIARILRNNPGNDYSINDILAFDGVTASHPTIKKDMRKLIQEAGIKSNGKNYGEKFYFPEEKVDLDVDLEDVFEDFAVITDAEEIEEGD